MRDLLLQGLIDLAEADLTPPWVSDDLMQQLSEYGDRKSVETLIAEDPAFADLKVVDCDCPGLDYHVVHVSYQEAQAFVSRPKFANHAHGFS